MIARLALECEEDDLVRLGAAHAAEFAPHLEFSPDRVRTVFRNYLSTAHPTIFVAVKNDAPVGYLSAGMYDYDFAAGFFTQQLLLFVSPVHRGSRAAAHLLKAFTEWSDEIGAREAFYGTSTDHNPDGFAKLVSRVTGAKLAGNSLKRVGV